MGRAAEWETLYQELLRRKVPRELIASSIVKLGKPYDAARIERAKDAVLQYLEDEDAVVRHEVLWFLGAWGPECLSALIHGMRSDSFEDNRAFAALNIGRTMRGSRDILATKELLKVLRNEHEENSVRLNAYRALLLVMKGKNADREANDFFWTEKGLQDIDWDWVDQLEPQ